MPEPRKSGDDSQADFVRRLVTDPASVPDLMRIYGYPGASSEQGHERLYLTADLTPYVDIPASAILHRMPATAEQDPFGGVTLWVRRYAELIQKTAPMAHAVADYFAGALQAQVAAGALDPASRLGTWPCGYSCDACNRTFGICPVSEMCVTPACSVGCPVASTVQTGCAIASTPAAGCHHTHLACSVPVAGCNNENILAGHVEMLARPAYGGGIPSFVCSYAQGRWFSFDACPTFYGGCRGPYLTPGCPQ